MASKDYTEHAYSLDPDVDRLALRVIAAIVEAGNRSPDFGSLRVEKMRKVETLVMRADLNNAERRFRPGSRLRTYTGVRNPDGSFQDETYAGNADLTPQSTIYRNIEPIRYSDQDADPAKRGVPVRGRFEVDVTEAEPVSMRVIVPTRSGYIGCGAILDERGARLAHRFILECTNQDNAPATGPRRNSDVSSQRYCRPRQTPDGIPFAYLPSCNP
jgi:hypothetical protein